MRWGAGAWHNFLVFTAQIQSLPGRGARVADAEGFADPSRPRWRSGATERGTEHRRAAAGVATTRTDGHRMTDRRTTGMRWIARNRAHPTPRRGVARAHAH